ncbi:MAG: LysM peptidoglycan-binding domain-containing protein [Bacteroidetes bacterium]|nr:LysM peptidoglycan-binding domain-containing protein [Bacteroidota bacterium]
MMTVFIDFEEEIIALEVEEKQPSTKLEDSALPWSKTIEPAISVAIYHTVAAIGNVACHIKKYQVTVGQIQKWNNLIDTNIKIGQQLILHYK